MFIDTHAHVNFKAFQADWREVLDECLRQDVYVVNVGSQFSTSKRAVELAEKYDRGVYAIVGLHPVHLFPMRVDEEESFFETRAEEFDYAKYLDLARDEKVLGIGECGLEYFHLPKAREAAVKKKQKEVFELQIKLAAEVGKTLMVHSRDAYDDIYEILKEAVQKPRSIVIHSFIGSYEQAEKFLSLGCYISFNGIITYKPRKEKKPGQSDPGLMEAVKAVPLDRILLETDCPYLSPEPNRGKRNTPLNVKIVAQKLAEFKGISLDEVEKQTFKNAENSFGLEFARF